MWIRPSLEGTNVNQTKFTGYQCESGINTMRKKWPLIEFEACIHDTVDEIENNNIVREAVNIYQTKIIILFIINENKNNSFININMF